MTSKELENLKKGDIIRYVWRAAGSVENFLIKLNAPAVKKIVLKSEDKMYQSEIVEFLQEIAMKIDTGVVKLVQGEESVELVIHF